MRRFGEDSGYDYSPVRIVLAKKDGDNLTHIGGLANSYLRDVWDMYEVDPGEYLAYIECDWIDDFTDNVGFSVYSSMKTEIKNVTLTNQDFMQRVYTLELARQEAEEKELAPNMYFYSGAHVGQT
jgi:hypothetical protein